MEWALLRVGQPHVLQQQLLAAAALKMMGHCDHQGGGTLHEYQSAAIALAVSLEAQVRQLHPCAWWRVTVLPPPLPAFPCLGCLIARIPAI